MDEERSTAEQQRLDSVTRAVLNAIESRQPPPAPRPMAAFLTWLSTHWGPISFGLTVAVFVLACIIYQVSPFLALKELRYKQDISRQQAAQREHKRMLARRHVELGKIFLDIGQYKGAELEYRDVLKLEPTNPDAEFGLAKARMYSLMVDEQFDPEVIEKRIHILQAERPNDPHTFVFLGDLYARLDPDVAIRHYRKALNLNAEVATAYYGLGLLYHAQDQTDQALAMFEAAVQRSKWNQDYLNNLAALYYDTRQYAKAVSTYELALRLDAEYLIAYHEMALAYRLQGDLDNALFYQQEMVSLFKDTKIAGLKKNSGQWYFKITDDRIAFYDLPEKRAYAHYSLSITLALLNRMDEAALAIGDAQKSGDHVASLLRPLIEYDLQRLHTEQPRFREHIQRYRARFLAPQGTRRSVHGQRAS